ncbi:hypothetical protein LGK97_09730 [Clostridium sp. CS001]|uniref:hypothetical protein n=1 Tax=Clostridium sp. CS001 TaxID=2880648 RepID=UPI001CF3313A|nr:hypothetical protein [Clostridium sp. CS001]MCB2290046.1 hypothetical protein [Clostridium sp. CS001]
MYFKEYIFPLGYYLVSIIILLCSIYYLLYRIFAVRKFEVRKRMEKGNFNFIFVFIGALIIISMSSKSSNNLNIFFAIISIAQGLWIYDYNFILDEGLFIKGKFISWSKINNLDYKDDKTAELSYFKKNQNSVISKMTFNIGNDAKLVLEDALKRKQVITNISNWENEDITQSFKSVQRGIALALIFVIMIFAYLAYSLGQPKYLEVVLAKTFNHEKTSSIVVRYPREVKDENMPFGNMSTTSKEEKINEVKDYLNSFSIRKIQLRDMRYRFIEQEVYEVTLYELDGDEVEIYISKKEPVIEIISKNKKRSYYIEQGYTDIDFINKFGQSIN